MTHRQRMLAVLRGEGVDRIPWCPRMDLWYISNKSRGSLPDRFAGMNTVEIARELDMGCHAVRADFTLSRAPESLIFRGLGFENHQDYPYRVELEDLPVEFRTDGQNWITRITTPAGEVRTHIRLTAQMIREGISLPFVQSYPIESADDFEAVAQVFDHLRVLPTPESYKSFQRRIGEEGLAVAGGMLAASPIHLMLHELIAMDRFFYLYMDERESLYRLAERMAPFFEAALEATLASSAEVVFWGANFDRDLTYPPFFEAEILPWLNKACRRIHAAGKLAVCHTDGENDQLFPLYSRAGFDMAESVCTSPMVKNTLKEIRERMGREKTVWGGIPSVALLENNMNDHVFDKFLDGTFEEIGAGDHLIFGVSDNVPPGADLARLERIKERIEDFGAIPRSV